MAINFLNTVDLNSIQIENIVPENANAGTIGAGVLGQMYFDTTQDTMMQYVANSDGAGNPGYIEIGATSAVESLIAGAGIGVSAAIGNITVRNTGLISVLDGTFIDLTKQGGGDNTQLTADLSAVDGTSTAADRFLTKANKWATIPFGDVTEVQGGTYITVTNPTGPVPIVNHDATSRSNTTSTAAPAYGATFTALDSITTNTTGHVTAVNTKTITIPASDNTTYDLLTAPTGTAIRLDPSTGTNDDVTISGTTGQTAMSRISASELRVALTDDVTIIDDLTVGGVITQTQANETNSFASPIDMNNNKLTEVKTGTLGTDGVNLAQVEALVAGLGSFQGGYNAATNSPALSGASNVAVGNGDFYVVTTAGTLFTKVLEVGDFIFANTNIPANSSPSESDYIFVISDANIAGAGATDGGTQKGVAGFDSANFDVSASGWVQLNSQRNPYGAKQSLNNTAPSSRAEAGGVTTFTLDLADASLFGTGALAENVKVEVTDGSSPYETVYACVTRSGSASMAIAFTGSIANDAYQVLLSHV